MIYVGIVAVIFLGELLIKNHIDKNWKQGNHKKICINKILLSKYKNKGAFLNFCEKYPKVIAIISLIFSLVILIYFIFTLGHRGNVALKVGLAMLLGGAFSNTYDRLKRKYVVDYFSFQTKRKKINSVVFNLADFCVIIGALLVTIAS